MHHVVDPTPVAPAPDRPRPAGAGMNIVCISSIDWDFIWQGHQEIMARFAAQGHRVLFIENTGVRSLRIRDLPRVRNRIRNWWRGTKGFREERPNLFVLSPLLVPLPYSRVAHWINSTLLLSALRRWMRAANFHRPIIWTFLPTPLARTVLHELDATVTIYYCIDDLASSSHAARKISKTEEQIFRGVDLVFVTSEKLRERAARFTDRVHLFPFTVNYDAFERVRLAPTETPPELRALPRPIIGYVGGVHQWVDQPTVAAVADALPGASVVLVGPRQTDASTLEARRNVHLLGARPHAQLPAYIKCFDVALIPYRLSEYTAHVFPTKLNEYLAMGVPVVGTYLPELERFVRVHGAVIRLARDANEFTAAVREAAAPSSPADIEQRVAIARRSDWSGHLLRMTELIDAAAETRCATPWSWEDALLRLYRRARRRTVAAVTLAALIYVLLFLTPLLWGVASPLRLAAPPERADAIVVFAGGVGESGQAGGGYQERVKQAIDLYKAGYAQRLIFSSGYLFAFREAEVMRDVAVANGVPADAIQLELEAANTYENVVFVKRLLDRQQNQSILLVSSPYHMRRALLVWRRQAPDIRVVPTPVPSSQFYIHGLGANLQQIRGIVHEYAAIIAYWWRGWL